MDKFVDRPIENACIVCGGELPEDIECMVSLAGRKAFLCEEHCEQLIKEMAGNDKDVSIEVEYDDEPGAA